jgi:small subunit ribosomal protein S11
VLPADGKLTVGYVLHCNFAKNNTHLTLCRQYRRVGKLAAKLSEQQKAIDMIRPLEEPLINLNTGMMGFKNTKKDTYEAAYQVTSEMFRRMEDKSYLDHGLEITLKQFAEGRRAFVAALNGKEGTAIRPHVNRVTDTTVIKFGGHRAPGPRRT